VPKPMHVDRKLRQPPLAPWPEQCDYCDEVYATAYTFWGQKDGGQRNSSYFVICDKCLKATHDAEVAYRGEIQSCDVL
jgi:hypothetical protein